MTMDEKQWLVSRLDETSKLIFGEFQLSREDFIRIREELTSSITSKRNTVLSSVVFILALLVGLHETQWVNNLLFLWILIPDVIIGLIAFVVASLFIRTTKSSFTRVENGIVRGQQALNHNFGFLIQNTLELTSVPITTLREYADFMRALAGIIYIPFANAMNQSSKSRLLDAYYKKSFTESATAFEKVIDPAISIFNRINRRNLPQEAVAYTASIIFEYKKKSDNIGMRQKIRRLFRL